MKTVKLSFIVIVVTCMAMIGGTALFFGPGCGSSSDSGDPQGSGATKRSALKLNGVSKKALFGQIYHDKTDNREWIFDGAQWVPHDSTVEEYYAQLDADKRIIQKSMTIDEVFSTCTASDATGAHAKHDAFTYTNNCKICHKIGGILCFDPAGPAVAPGKPLPSFDATSKICSNISCHGMYSGTYGYYSRGGDGEAVYELALYSGAGGTTPNWNATGVSCTACHGNPPTIPDSTMKYIWHSGYHGGGNECQLCHPDVTGTGGVGTAITNPTLHANGTVDVQAAFKRGCFNCH